ncbi:hypothetical protein DFA_00271 [Cavenderia fasciculata]|uniref:Uncharacterized protein n=1 Tax=Cavenderia fasciculata TaxID=261658 RepID=F4PY33_CACFS|nr:uncharacterized protein DFA_00271 [Cavenderia fasciculata]EGG19693.1 hypothetical protein DFA_00271 [Cavenderia fasciculata]|eukprot:XP_004357987.1 hypothetical protein DFA_00271 [Cavenderia fasciculata]
MRQRKNTFQFANKNNYSNSLTTTNNNSDSNNNNDDDDNDEDDNEETTTTSTTTNTVNVEHVTKRQRKNNGMTFNSNNNNNPATTVIGGSYQFNNNNKRIHFDDDDEEKDKSRTSYKEDELKSKLKKDLLVICERLDIRATMNQTKDTIVKNIIKIQNDRFQYKTKMIDNNPLCNFNKGLLEYSLPWPIIGRILDLVWTESSICTCYYSHKFINSIQTQSPSNYQLFYHFQMWPVYQPLLDMYKESRMKCPMHTYHYLNDIYPSINIGGPFVCYSNNDRNQWRYQLLGISKRVNQFLSSKYFNNVRLVFNQDLWGHINNQYCPIKTPKQLTIVQSYDYQNFAGLNTLTFASVAKLTISEGLYIPPAYHKGMQDMFRNITSLTLRGYLKMRPQFLTKFKNLTSIKITCVPRKRNRQEFLDVLQPGIVKLILPIAWCAEPATLSTDLANTIQVSNIIPPLQMPNLHTFHIPPTTHFPSYDTSSSFNHPKIKKIVNHNFPTSTFTSLPPPTVETLKFVRDHSNNNFNTDIFSELNVKQLMIQSHYEISDKTINDFKRCGYEYHGTIFKATKRWLNFIKTTTPTPDITIETTPPEIIQVPTTSTTVNNSTLPNYLIEKIFRYSWNSYYCTCEIETNTLNPNQYHYQITDYVKQAKEFVVAKSICPIHKYILPSFGTYRYESVLKQINQRRFGLTLTCKRLFEYISNRLVNRVAFSYEESEISKYHQHFSNQYCLIGKSIKSLTIDSYHNSGDQSWEFLDLHHYSNVQHFMYESCNPYFFTNIGNFIQSLSRLQFITSLDLSHMKIDPGSASALHKLKDIPLRKLYYFYPDNQFLFKQQQQQQQQDDDDPNRWRLTQSLEAVSINSFDVISKLDRLPKLRHLRIIIDNSPYPQNVSLTDQQIQTQLPSNITKLSFKDTNIAQITTYSTSNYQRPFIPHQSNFEFIGTFYSSTRITNALHHTWVYQRKKEYNIN